MRISDWSSDVCSSELEIGEQRRAQQRPPEAVDSYPIAVQRKLQPPVGTKIGVRPPCDIGKQTGGVANAGQLRRLVGEQRRDPLVQVLALSLATPFPVAFGARRLGPQVERLHVRCSLLVNEPLPQAHGGYEELQFPPPPHQN